MEANTQNTETKTVKEYKVGRMEKFFGSTGLAMHKSMSNLRDIAAAHPISGTFTYVVAAPYAVTTAPIRGLFNRQAYEKYAKAEHENPDTVVDIDLLTNKVYAVPEKQKTPCQAPSTSALVWGGVAATALAAAGILGMLARKSDDGE